MPTDEILTLEIEPPYIGSAVSPTVDIDETTDDITVTITDFRGEHSYTVEKTDGAIADAEQAAQNANDTAQTVAQGWANRQNEINVTTNSMRTLMTNSANAESQRVIAENARVTAENARVQEWDELSTDATAATDAANAATVNATSAANRADDASRVANEMISRGNTTITNISNTANQIFGQAGQAIGEANTATTNANNAATNADTATQAANTATTNATNAAQAANNAADVAIEAAEDMPRLIGTVDTAQTVADAWPTTIESATVYGKCVQDGTPTPENPVEVQVVGGRNLYNPATRVNGYWINDLGVIGTDQNSCYSDKIPVTVGEDYSFAITVYGSTFKRVVAYDANDSFVALLAKLPIHIGEHETGTVTIPPNTAYVRISLTQNDQDAQLEAGTQATPYIPYGCIGLKVGDEITPIDLQGNVLASLPDGTRDELDINGASVKTIAQRVYAHTFDGTESWTITKNADGKVNAVWQKSNSFPDCMYGVTGSRVNCLSDSFVAKNFYYSSTDAPIGSMVVNSATQILFMLSDEYDTTDKIKAFMAGKTVYYALATPQTIELGTITPPSIAPGDTLAIYASLDPDWQIEYTQDPSIVVNTLQSSIAPVEGSTASTNYAVGAYLMHGNQLYRVTSAIATGEAITPGSNCVACTVMGEVIRLTA